MSNFTITYDATAPNISLVAPDDGASFSSSQQITFSYNVNENLEMNCNLMINGAISLTENVSSGANSFTQNFAPGSYVWYVKCVDLAGNEANSTGRSFTVTAPAPPPPPPA